MFFQHIHIIDHPHPSSLVPCDHAMQCKDFQSKHATSSCTCDGKIPLFWSSFGSLSALQESTLYLPHLLRLTFSPSSAYSLPGTPPLAHFQPSKCLLFTCHTQQPQSTHHLGGHLTPTGATTDSHFEHYLLNLRQHYSRSHSGPTSERHFQMPTF